MSNEVLNCHNINKSFKNMNGDELQILNNINFVIKSGETNSIVGSSGSGKTSLLQILAGLDTPTSGKVIVCDKDISKLTDMFITQSKVRLYLSISSFVT